MTDTLTDSSSQAISAKPSGFFSDLLVIAGRAIRSIPREPEVFIPALFIPAFFFVVNIGTFQDLTETAVGGVTSFDYKAFQMPTAIIFAVTGISRATGLVTDIQTGYFDRLLLTPTKRLPLLLGLMVADLLLVICLCIPVVILGLLVGVSFASGVLGLVAFVLIAGFWGLAFTGFPYAIALKTGSAAAVGSSFLLFFPFAFLTSATVPLSELTGWLGAIADFNPLTYILEGMRSLVFEGWNWSSIGKALLAIFSVGAVSQGMALMALRGRISRG